ncbi:MAG: hypothetical protein AB1611_05040 [bacterium]
MKRIIGYALILLWIMVISSGRALASENPGEGEKDQKPPVVQQDADAAIPMKDPNSFARGYALFEKKNYAAAAPRLFHFLSMNSPDVVDYEWAQFFFGICLKKCGLSHAAVDELVNLIVRKPNPRIVSYCLELFEEITRTIPFDRELIINTVVCDQEYGALEEEMADFINYYQGMFDWERGFFQWGDNHFHRITPKSYYYYRYLFQKAMLRIYQDKIDEAMAIAQDILESPGTADDLKSEAATTLARLLYEKGEHAEAERIYQKNPKPVLEQAQTLFERAWNHYRLGNSEKAMGLLYAFEAPGFRDYFTPEHYILKSLIYKEVCHYQKALAVVREFKAHYGHSLETIYARGEAADDPGLLLLLLSKKKINQTWRFLKLLEQEKEKIALFPDKPLCGFLDKLYTLEIEKMTRVLRTQIKEEYEKMANEILKFEEEANLMEYEIGLDMYQRVYQYHYREDAASAQKPTGRIAIYPFQGEFWNDELDDYTVTLPNKCNCLEEWDIFFK